MENVACICRVSTDKQELDNQRLALERYCEAKGYEVIRWFGGVESGGKPNSNLLNDILHEARTGVPTALRGRKFYHRVVVVRADRLPTFRCGIGPVFELVKILAAAGLDIESISEPWLTTSGPMSELLLAVLGWMAQQERLTIKDRTRAGMARKKKECLEKGMAYPVRGKDRVPRKKRSDAGKARRQSIIPVIEGTPEIDQIPPVNAS